MAKGSHVLSQGWTVPSSSHTATQVVGISEVEVGWEVENGVPEPLQSQTAAGWCPIAPTELSPHPSVMSVDPTS